MPARSTEASIPNEYRLGCAKIDLKHLDFQDSVVIGGTGAVPLRMLDPKNVCKLEKTLRKVGVCRNDPRNFVPAIISRELFRSSLEENSRREDGGRFLLSETDCSSASILKLQDGVKVSCLHGRHRIEAAKLVLPARDRWWVVEFYADDLPLSFSKQVTNDYPKGRNLPDDFVYRNLRAIERSPSQRDYWLGILAESKKKDYNQLCNGAGTAQLEHLDALLPFAGLWPDFLFSPFHRMAGERCVPELVRYLKLIKSVWSDATLGRDDIRRQVDVQTVRHLELLCPKHSSKDRRTIVSLIQKGDIFPSITDESDRSQIQDRLLSIQSRIPSFHTFSLDAVYFKDCAEIMRRCLTSRLRRDEQLEDRYDFMYVGDNFWSDYRELWIFVMRNCSRLQHRLLRPRARHRNAAAYGAARQAQAEFAREAQRLHFDIGLVTAGENIGMENIESPIEPELSTDDDELEPKSSRRAQHQPEHFGIRRDLSLSNMYRDYSGDTKAHISSFGMLREVFLAFLGPGTPILVNSRPKSPVNDYTMLYDLPALSDSSGSPAPSVRGDQGNVSESIWPDNSSSVYGAPDDGYQGDSTALAILGAPSSMFLGVPDEASSRKRRYGQNLSDSSPRKSTKDRYNFAVENFLSRVSEAGCIYLCDCERRRLFQFDENDTNFARYMGAWVAEGQKLWVIERAGTCRFIASDLEQVKAAVRKCGGVIFSNKSQEVQLWEEVLEKFQSDTTAWTSDREGMANLRQALKSRLELRHGEHESAPVTRTPLHLIEAIKIDDEETLKGYLAQGTLEDEEL